MEEENSHNLTMEGDLPTRKHKGKHDKPKPWDDESIDHWKIEKFDPSWNEAGLLEASSFSTIFPAYREKYLQEVWPIVRSALKQHGISCDLNLVEGSMTVSTTLKTRDPYIIIKARDLIRLLSRSVPAPQAIKILDDEMQCDVIKINGLVRRKDRFVKRRQQLMGSNSTTLKAIEILTGCYVLIQGSTVSAMGSFKGLKQVRKIVEDCMTNKWHPIFHIKVLMMRRELEKLPHLKHENWDRFLPKFKKRNVQQKKAKSKKEKKTYTPFPPPQPLSKIDLQLESGEYFLSDKKKSAKKWQEKQDQQSTKSAENKRKRDEAFLPPEEPAKVDTRNAANSNNDVTSVVSSLKKRAKELGSKKAAENVNAENYIAAPTESSKKKKCKVSHRL